MIFLLIFSLSANEVVKGTTAVLKYDKASVPDKILAGDKELDIMETPAGDGYFVLVPVNYKIKDKEIDIVEVRGQNEKVVVFDVLPGHYKQEKLRVNPSKVNPSKKARERIAKEYKEAMAIYRTTTPARYWEKPFDVPLKSKITSNFGNARVFNGELKSYHSGTDFKAATGTPIKASNDGVVVIAKKRYYAGGSVVIDHGEGLYTCYYHLSQIDVKVGEKVKKGEVVGKSGATGRVTGPHLHFAVMVKGVQVDPMDFVKKMNALF